MTNLVNEKPITWEQAAKTASQYALFKTLRSLYVN